MMIFQIDPQAAREDGARRAPSDHRSCSNSQGKLAAVPAKATRNPENHCAPEIDRAVDRRVSVNSRGAGAAQHHRETGHDGTGISGFLGKKHNPERMSRLGSPLCGYAALHSADTGIESAIYVFDTRRNLLKLALSAADGE